MAESRHFNVSSWQKTYMSWAAGDVAELAKRGGGGQGLPTASVRPESTGA